ncbi:MAG: hypothetical protein KF770_23690 [Anaerolineae bacterium]|nr:hypothetical protein [Anaerolineae bacterium]
MKESIGGFGDGELPHEREWIMACYDFAIAYLKRVCGEPPRGYTLEPIYHEHETLSGNILAVPSLGITWENPHADAPWDYLEKCEIALRALDDAIDWAEIEPGEVAAKFPEEKD